MSSASVTVRVLAARALTLADANSSTTLHVAGDEVELAPDEAKELIEQGLVERV